MKCKSPVNMGWASLEYHFIKEKRNLCTNKKDCLYTWAHRLHAVNWGKVLGHYKTTVVLKKGELDLSDTRSCRSNTEVKMSVQYL